MGVCQNRIVTESKAIAVFEDRDGILLFGSEDALETLDQQTQNDGIVSLRLPAHSLSRAGQVLTTAAQVQAESGRWLKLTSESAGLVRAMGPSLAKADGLMTGVVRSSNGQILKHLKFENAALLTPAAPAALGVLATQMALDAALEEITAYLVTIDAKLDRLLRERKTEALAALGGVTMAIDEAHAIYKATGTVSTTTWSKVQGTATALATMQASGISHLSALADGIKEAVADAQQLALATSNAKEDAPFWLGVMARTVVLEDKLYVLELARVADDDPDEVEAHRQGIAIARTERMGRIGASLGAIGDELHNLEALPAHRKVTNPFKMGRVVENVNHVNRDVTSFAAAVGLDGVDPKALADTPWSVAVRTMVGDGAKLAVGTGAEAVNVVKGLGQRVEDARDDATLRRAARIQDERRVRQLEDGSSREV